MKSFLTFFILCQTAFCADYLTGQAARLEIGQSNFTRALAQQPPTINTLGAVSGVAYANNMLFVVDGSVLGLVSGAPTNNRVLIYTPVSGFPSVANPSGSANTIGVNCGVCLGNPSIVLGQPDFVSYLPAVTSAGLNTPSAVATDGKVLAVADTNNNRVLIWKSIPTVSGQPADVVLGQPDFTHGAVIKPATAQSLSGPQGVWIWNGKLFIADTSNDRVLIFNSIPTANATAADVVVGQVDFKTVVLPPVTQPTVPPTQNNLSSPTSVTTDGTHLFVTDLGHNRVMIWNSIPTSNNTNADVVVGQPDFVSQVSNNSFSSTTTNSVMTSKGVLCASNGTDTSNNPTFPFICGSTLSFPRFAVTDSQGRFYISDGGNDRVLGYNIIPQTNAPHADFILGEPDEFTDSATGGTDALQTPSSLAWDGTNLWVADTLDLRVMAFTPAGNQLQITGVRNAASLQIYATGTVTLTGTPTAADTVSVTIGTTAYKYTVVKGDTLTTILNALVAMINGTASGSTKDPNVLATGDVSANVLVLTALKAGNAGIGTALSTAVTSTSIVATISGTTITINLANAAQIAPGTLITLYGSNLTTQTAAADLTQTYLPTSLGGASLYVDGIAAPLLYVSPGQINAQMPFETQDRSSVSVYVVSDNGGTATATNAIGSPIVPENPGLFAGGGTDPRPGVVYHYSANATGLVLVNGFAAAGDIATVTIAGTRNYSYAVQAADTTLDVAEALAVQINAEDPDVSAVIGNEYSRIVLTARQPGKVGDGIAYTVSTSAKASISLIADTTNTGTTGTSLCCASSGGLVTVDNPAVPGEIVYTYATGLGPTNASGTSTTGKIVTSVLAAPAYPVDSIVAGGKSAQQIFAVPVPGLVGVYQVAFLLDGGMTTDQFAQLTIAQRLFVSNIVTFAVQVPPTN